jgi:VacB/RNase II family 3'-5' exoribonuclease
MSSSTPSHIVSPANSAAHPDLQVIAREIMLERGFQPDFPPPVLEQAAELQKETDQASDFDGLRDLRSLLWSSIDNDTSKDLDQIEVAEQLPNGDVRVLIGIADVDAKVARNSPIDQHAGFETTTVYTGVRNFSMIPEVLSTDITSLNEDADRPAMVIEFVVSASGELRSEDVYQALVRNKAQLTYSGVGNWLGGTTAAPGKVATSAELQAQIKMQDTIAQVLRALRFQNGALNIDTVEVRPVFLSDKSIDVVKQERNRASELIEDFMIAANGVVARKLLNVSSIRRVVKTPERWDRIVALAAQNGGHLPSNPDSKALNEFLMQRKDEDPVRFADLSLAVIKLMGPGQYVLERPGDAEQGHFGLAVQDYTHSTAPNRRFADMVTHRILKAQIGQQAPPYADAELETIANNCTSKEDAARKVEREMNKRIAAVAMSPHVGQTFDAVVTGASQKGTFVRILKPLVEGMLVQGAKGLDVGDTLTVKLLRTNVQNGFIDFARA